MVDDEWVKAAMTDDMVVVELLVRLKQSETASVSAKSHSMLPPLSWGMKQPRSRLTATSRCSAAANAAMSTRKEAYSTRCSPTTPLSWSGGASPSPTVDGYEESSRPIILSHHAARSKATATSEFTSNSASTKRCRKKKNFAELKEEESSLLKESIYLKKEIANVNATLMTQRARNESLKRMKLNLGSTPHNKPSSTSDELQCTLPDQPYPRLVPFRSLTLATEDDTHPQPADSRATRTQSTGESLFLIPDLNMMPSENDSCTDALC